jgi:hypothetical protein
LWRGLRRGRPRQAIEHAAQFGDFAFEVVDTAFLSGAGDPYSEEGIRQQEQHHQHENFHVAPRSPAADAGWVAGNSCLKGQYLYHGRQGGVKPFMLVPDRSRTRDRK